MGAYWDQLLSYAPEVMWKLDEADASATVIDYSGNGRDGTVTVAGADPNFQEPSLINPEPSAGSVYMQGTTSRIAVSTSDSWANTPGDVSYVVAFAPRDTSSSVRNIIGRNFLARVGLIGSTGTLRFTLSIAGTFQTVDSAPGIIPVYAGPTTPPVPDQKHLIIAQREGSDIVIYLDGAEVARATFAGATTETTSRPFQVGYDTSGLRPGGWHQGAAYFKRSLTAQEIADLYAVFNAPPNVGPDTPTWSMLSPDGDPTGKTFDTQMQVGATTTDPEGDPIEYWWEFSSDGGLTWGDNFEGVPYSWSLPGQNSRTWGFSTVGYGTTYRVRVKARDVPVGAESGWLESGDFTISHPGEQPAKPTLSALQVTDFSVLMAVGYSSPEDTPWYRTRVQIIMPDRAGEDSFAAPPFDSDFQDLTDPELWITGLPFASRIKLRVQVMDFGGNTSEFSDEVEIFTPRVRTAVDRDPPMNLGTMDNSLWRYGHWSTAVPITDFSPSSDRPDIGVELDNIFGIPGYAARFNMTLFNTGTGVSSLTPEDAFQNDLENEAGYPGNSIARLYGAAVPAEWPEQWSMLVGFAPFHEPTSFGLTFMELLGSPNAFHFRINTDGSVVLQAVNDNRVVNSTLAEAGAVQDGQMNVLSFVHEADPNNIISTGGDGCPALSGASTPAVVYAGLNESFSAETLSMVLTDGGPDCDDFFIHSNAGPALTYDFIDLGKGSSQVVSSATLPFRGYIGPFILWLGTVLTAAEYAKLQAIIRGMDSDDLEEYVLTGIIRNGAAVQPDIFMMFDQPRRPSRPRISVGS